MNNNSYPIDMAFTTRQLEQGKEKGEVPAIEDRV